MPKATQVEIEQRVNTVYELLMNGASRHAICQHAAKTWGISFRTTDRLIAQANKAFEEEAATVRERELGKSIRRLETLFLRSMHVQDYKTCLSVQREINTMLGLHAPSRSEHEIKDWRTQAIADIKAGALTYDAVARAFDDDSLAAELFREAGVLVNSE